MLSICRIFVLGSAMVATAIGFPHYFAQVSANQVTAGQVKVISTEKDAIEILPAFHSSPAPQGQRKARYFDQIIRHIEKNVGPITMTLSPPDGILENHVDLVLVAPDPGKNRYFWYVVTAGMSNHPPPILEGLKEQDLARVELSMALPPHWCTALTTDGLLPDDVDVKPLQELLYLSQFPQMQKEPVSYGLAIETRRGRKNNVIKGFVMGWPLAPSNVNFIKMKTSDDNLIRFWGAYPLFRGEMRHRRKHGMTALENLFDKTGLVEYYDPSRHDLFTELKLREQDEPEIPKQSQSSEKSRKQARQSKRSFRYAKVEAKKPVPRKPKEDVKAIRFEENSKALQRNLVQQNVENREADNEEKARRPVLSVIGQDQNSQFRTDSVSTASKHTVTNSFSTQTMDQGPNIVRPLGSREKQVSSRKISRFFPDRQVVDPQTKAARSYLRHRPIITDHEKSPSLSEETDATTAKSFIKQQPAP